MRLGRRFVSLVCAAALVLATLPVDAHAANRVQDGPVAVKLAVVAPFTGYNWVYGAGIQHACQLAINDYASELASAGVTVTVAVYDDKGTAASAARAAAAAVADTSVVGVVGHVFSDCAIAAAPIYHAADLAMISPGASRPGLTALGFDDIFRVCPNDLAEGAFGADTARDNLQARRAFVVYEKAMTASKPIAGAFAGRFTARGGKVVGQSALTPSKLTAIGKKIKASKPDVVYVAASDLDAAVLAVELRARNSAVQILVNNDAADGGYVIFAQKAIARGTLATVDGLPTDELPGGAAFASQFASAYPGASINEGIDPYARDAAAAVLRAVIDVATESGASALLSPGVRGLVTAKVAATSFTGITGLVGFTSSGENTNPQFGVLRVRSGKWRECAKISAPQLVPGTMLPGVPLTFMGTLAPHHPAGSKAVTLDFYRRTKGRWVLAEAVKATVSDSGVFSAYTAIVKLPKRGSWRVVAVHSDASHPSFQSPPKDFAVM